MEVIVRDSTVTCNFIRYAVLLDEAGAFNKDQIESRIVISNISSGCGRLRKYLSQL